MLPPQLDSEIQKIREDYKIEVTEEQTLINIVIFEFPTSNLYTMQKTTLLLRVPRAYPDAGIDMFWTDVNLILTDNSIPSGAQYIEEYMNKKWRRYSWHPNPGNPRRWNPTVDSLISYLDFVKRRFNQR